MQRKWTTPQLSEPVSTSSVETSSTKASDTEFFPAQQHVKLGLAGKSSQLSTYRWLTRIATCAATIMAAVLCFVLTSRTDTAAAATSSGLPSPRRECTAKAPPNAKPSCLEALGGPWRRHKDVRWWTGAFCQSSRRCKRSACAWSTCIGISARSTTTSAALTSTARFCRRPHLVGDDDSAAGGGGSGGGAALLCGPATCAADMT